MRPKRIWRLRNDVFFNCIRLDEHLKVEHLNRSVTEMIEAYHKLEMVNGDYGRNGDVVVRWAKPIAPAINVNVD